MENTIEVMFSCTDNHPDGEADPCAHVQLHHEVDVDENTEQGQPGEQRDLERTEKWRMRKKQLPNDHTLFYLHFTQRPTFFGLYVQHTERNQRGSF